jgi:hypothetical protein
VLIIHTVSKFQNVSLDLHTSLTHRARLFYHRHFDSGLSCCHATSAVAAIVVLTVLFLLTALHLSFPPPTSFSGKSAPSCILDCEVSLFELSRKLNQSTFPFFRTNHRQSIKSHSTCMQGHATVFPRKSPHLFPCVTTYRFHAVPVPHLIRLRILLNLLPLLLLHRLEHNCPPKCLTTKVLPQ